MATLLNDRNELLYTASSRVTGASVTLSAGTATTILVPKNATVPVPITVTLTASVIGYITPSYSYSYRFGNTGNFIALTGTTNPLVVPTGAAFLTGAGTSTLVQYKVDVTETASNIGVNQSSYTLSIPILREGTDGINAINSMTVVIYRRTSTAVAPELITTGNSTYTFLNGTLVGQPSGWSQTPPSAVNGAYLWSAQVVAASTTGNYQFANNTWSTPVLFTQDGIAGTPGANTALIYAYKRTAAAPTDNPGAVEYNFNSATITTPSLANNWSKTIPAGADTLYVTLATASSTTNIDSISATEWATPVVLSQNGINSATVYLYARNNNSTTAPTVDTSGSATYSFEKAKLEGVIPTGWTQALPVASNGSVLWAIFATAASTSGTDSIANTEWGTPQVLSQNGSNGSNGSNGTNGTRGSRQLYSNSTSYNSGFTYNSNSAGPASYAVKATDLIAAAVAGTIPTTPITGDTVTFTNGSNYVYTITYNSSTSTWVTPGTVVDGSLLVTGSVTAAKINSNGLTIRDTAGNIILSAGADLASSTLNIPGTVTQVPPGWLNDNIKVGGTNLFFNSSRFTSTDYWYSNGGTVAIDTTTTYAGYNTIRISGTAGGAQHSPVMRLKADTLYTVSALVKGSSTLGNAYDNTLHIQSWRDEDTGNVHQETAVSADTAVTTSWRLVQQTFRTPVSATATYCRFYIYPLVTGFTLNIAYTKLEEGNKVSDWTPNPEEIKNSNVTVDINGALQGIGAGAGTAVKNSNISISDGGTLSGAGGGTVKLTGLGYSGDLDATKGAQSGTNLKDSSGTVIKDDAFRNNLINVDWWRRDAAIPWSINDEYNRIISVNPSSGGDITETGPRGGNDLVWYCQEVNNNGNSGGGWNANISSQLDPNKTYRFAIAIRVGNNNGGTAYWGTGNVCDLNTTNYNGNPYFAVYNRDAMSPDRWYLFVGYVFPYGSLGNSSDSAGVWDCKTGLKVGGGTNYNHTASAANTHRAYQYYANNGANQRFSRPMINMVDGTEPSLREYFEPNAVLNNAISISSGGKLTGAGGGTVSISGLGYSGDLNATYGADWATNVTGAAGVNTNITNATSAAAAAVAAAGVAQTAADDKLSKSASSTLSATVSVNAVTGAGFRSGNLTWDANGNRTGGSGVALTPGGLVGVNVAGETTFAINASNGNASFKGSIEGSSGNFTGTLNGANITGATGNFTGTLTAGTVDLTKLIGVTYRYDTPGTYYPTVPPDYTQMRVTLVGGGGGGSSSSGNGASGSGGGGGGLVIATITVIPGQQVLVYVGAGGAGGNQNGGGFTMPGYNGDSGNNTYVNANTMFYSDKFVLAGGGDGGRTWQDWSTIIVTPGGTGTVNGSNGEAAGEPDSGFIFGGHGGNSGSNYGIGGYGYNNDYSYSGKPGSLYGGGGGGGNNFRRYTNSAGGNGAGGLAIIEFFNPNGVIIRTEWNALISALQRQGIQTT